MDSRRRILMESGGGPLTNDIKVQHIQYDMPGGTTRTLISGTDFDAVGNLDYAFIWVTNSKKISGGTPGATGSNLEPQVQGANIYFNSGTGNIEIASTSGGIRRLNFSIVEYIGSAGGPNEFKVVDRGAVNATPSATSQSRTLANTPGDIDKCVPFYNVANSLNTVSGLNGLTISIWYSGINTINYHRGGNQATTTTRVETVEFIGSNWSVGHRSYIGANDGPLDLTIRTNAEGTSGTFDVGDWSNAFILDSFSGDKNLNTNVALADCSPVYYPPISGSTTSVTTKHDGQHDSNGTNNFMFHVVVNSEMNVQRIYNTDSSENETTIDITSFGLTSLETSLVHGMCHSSGSGVAYMRGTRNYYLKSTTEMAHWCHRSGNTLEHRIEVIDFENLKS